MFIFVYINTEKIMKKCSKCLEIKPLEEFEARLDSKDGRRTYCRMCKNKRHNQRLKERHEIDDSLFWKLRANDLNKASGRRDGIAGNIIRSSQPILFNLLRDLYENQNKKCCYCKKLLTIKQIVFDHMQPLSRNGFHNIDNISVCCEDCNRLKHTKNVEEFHVFLNDYITRFS